MEQNSELSVYDVGYLVVSQRVANSGEKVCWMYRETPPDDFDSGWRLFSGNETEAYVSDPNNLAMMSVESIEAIDPDVLPLLLASPGSAYEREDGDEPFVEAEFPED